MRRALSAFSLSSRPGQASVIFLVAGRAYGSPSDLRKKASQASTRASGSFEVDERREPVRRLLVVGAAGAERVEETTRVRAVERPGDHLLAERFAGLARRKTERRAQLPDLAGDAARLDQPGADGIALLDEPGERRLLHLIAGRGQHRAKRRAEIAAGVGGGACQHGAAGVGDQRGGAALVEHLEVAGDVRLEGKLVEQPLAEGVDRLDLQAAGRVERLGEQAPRLGQCRRAGNIAFKLLDAFGQRRVVEGRPCAKFGEHPVRHLRGRRLGEGQAEDARRVGAGQKQADDAARQHVGLARAGVRRHPCRRVRVGRRLGHHRLRCEGVAHAPPPPPSTSFSLSTSDHSRTRARWS